MSGIKLLPCPFCGGEARVCESEIDNHNMEYYVACDECDTCSCCAENKNEAVRAWNTRKPMERIVEQLEHERRTAFLTLANAPDIPDMVYEKVSLYLDKAIEIVKSDAK